MCAVLDIAGGLGVSLALIMALGAGGLYAASRPSWSGLSKHLNVALPQRLVVGLPQPLQLVEPLRLALGGFRSGK